MIELLGYADPKYAYSLSEFGNPVELINCGGWILERNIPNTNLKDATGCYPLFTCRYWSKIHEDLLNISHKFISLSIVTNPFADIGRKYLQSNFDYTIPFKNHYIANLFQSPDSFVSKGHIKRALKSLKEIDIEICTQPIKYIDDWNKLYNFLKNRHNINGINAFSPRCFAIQLKIPGMLMIIARKQRAIIGALLLLIHNEIGYAHLSAFNDEGYKSRASYALHWIALQYLYEKRILYAHFGGTAGMKEDLTDGLALFKKGWSNELRLAYLCCQIFDMKKYNYLCQKSNTVNTDFFPAYRAYDFKI